MSVELTFNADDNESTSKSPILLLRKYHIIGKRKKDNWFSNPIKWEMNEFPVLMK